MQLARVDRSTTPSTIELPREYNAAVEFIDVNLARGRAEKTAFIDAAGRYTYGELAERVNRAGNALRTLRAGMETRVLMCMLDGIDFSAVFWGAIKAGCVPIPVNTLLTSGDYAHLLRDSRARIVVVSEALLDRFEPALVDQPHVEQVVVAGNGATAGAQPAAAGTPRRDAPPAAAGTDAVARRKRRRTRVHRPEGVDDETGGAPPPSRGSARRGIPSARPGAHHLRRRGLLALYLRLHRHAERLDAPAPRPRHHRRALRRRDPSASGRTISSTPPPSSSLPTASATA